MGSVYGSSSAVTVTINNTVVIAANSGSGSVGAVIPVNLKLSSGDIVGLSTWTDRTRLNVFDIK